MTNAATVRRTGLLVVALGLLTTLGPLSIDLYLPAFPTLRDEFGADDGAVQLTLAGMTVGLALGNLVTGAWSDRVGRRLPLLLASALHVLVTLLCAAAPTLEALAALRVAQGVAAAGSSVLVLAIARDVSDGPGLVRLISRITLITTTVPLLAPVAGAVLLPVVGWRGIFGVLGAFSAAVLVVTAMVVPETHAGSVGRGGVGDRGEAADRNHTAPADRGLRARLRAVLRDPGFRAATLLGAMTYAGVYAYVAASPLLLQGVHGLTAGEFAAVFLANSLGLVVGVQASAALQRRRPDAPVLIGFAALTAGAALAILPLERAGAGLPGLLVCLWLFVAGCGGCFAGAAGRALRDQSAQAGTATSLYGFGTFAAAGLIAPVAGLIGLHDAAPIAGVLSVTALVGTTAAVAIRRRDRRAVLPPSVV
ncbi:MFS transporter [Promicromonospora sukumoe]|uniref:MFS transporter n=1 Tax=Promicromonospora sukumoe TaxID=88382 RepID=UPI000381D0EF|nr:MFS transporter [Promicromonospora sukumoe]